jgi:agmatine deiminase
MSLKSASHAYRLPAEWAPHDAVWIGWPHNVTDWPSKFSPIPWVFGEMIRHLATSERVRVVCNDEAHRAKAKRVLRRAAPELLADSAAPRVEFVLARTNRGWTRDFMPLFAELPGQGGAVLKFGFNGWAKYQDHERDDEAGAVCGRRIAGERGWRYVEVTRGDRVGAPVFCEGGALDVNGRGSILVSEECLLDPDTQVRNPGLGRAGYEAVFSAWCGAGNVLWLGRGIVGDDTHGHVDDFCRFVGPKTILLCQEPDARDPNHAILEENRERLESARLEDGARPEVVRLPMPAPLYFDGQRLPASYANFYIGNTLVLVPTFNDENDRKALGIIAELFPGRRVLGLHAVDLVLGLGAVHCLTHEQPSF